MFLLACSWTFSVIESEYIIFIKNKGSSLNVGASSFSSWTVLSPNFSIYSFKVELNSAFWVNLNISTSDFSFLFIIFLISSFKDLSFFIIRLIFFIYFDGSTLIMLFPSWAISVLCVFSKSSFIYFSAIFFESPNQTITRKSFIIGISQFFKNLFSRNL